MIIVTRAWAKPEGWTGPVWLNANGDEFAVSSGLEPETFNDAQEPDGPSPEAVWTPDMEVDAPQAPAVIAGLNGLQALALMGLAVQAND